MKRLAIFSALLVLSIGAYASNTSAGGSGKSFKSASGVYSYSSITQFGNINAVVQGMSKQDLTINAGNIYATGSFNNMLNEIHNARDVKVLVVQPVNDVTGLKSDFEFDLEVKHNIFSDFIQSGQVGTK